MPGHLWTGQKFCYDINGTIVPCRDTGQDGDFKTGISWPRERFTATGVGFKQEKGFHLWPVASKVA